MVSIAESDEEADISTASGQDGAVSTASAHGGGGEEAVWSMKWTTIRSPPPPPVAKTTSSTHESSEIGSDRSEVEASSLGSDASAGLLLRDAKYHCEVYRMPDTEKLWFWNSMTDEYFVADQPGSWTLYRTEQGEGWWWGESTKEWFWQ